MTYFYGNTPCKRFFDPSTIFFLKGIEIEFFRWLQKIGKTHAHFLSIQQSKFQLHKIKLHAIVIVK